MCDAFELMDSLALSHDFFSLERENKNKTNAKVIHKKMGFTIRNARKNILY